VNAEEEMRGRRGLRVGRLVSIVGVVMAAAAGCSTKVAYEAVQNRQRLECQKIQDPSARSKCLTDASTPYEDYKRQSELAKATK
jgi:hypothetical protein